MTDGKGQRTGRAPFHPPERTKTRPWVGGDGKADRSPLTVVRKFKVTG